MKNHPSLRTTLLIALSAACVTSFTGCASVRTKVAHFFAGDGDRDNVKRFAGGYTPEVGQKNYVARTPTPKRPAPVVMNGEMRDLQPQVDTSLGYGAYRPRRPVVQAQATQVQAVSTSRMTDPAEYRVLYFPDEQNRTRASDPYRVAVKASDERMKSNLLEPRSRGNGVGALSPASGPDYSNPSAQSYIAPDQDLLSSARRLSQPRQSNIVEVTSTYRTAEYRPAKARMGNPATEVPGMVRPLGITDPNALQAAADALDKRAGELLVFYTEFGWGGFIPNY